MLVFLICVHHLQLEFYAVASEHQAWIPMIKSRVLRLVLRGADVSTAAGKT
eukprot:m.39446 g.39446  ORF g.39446 m.39446 type:complete len:51 (+) comp14716_c0_seq5:1919-2071(+)